jgi:DNA-binding NtrC family response regulator
MVGVVLASSKHDDLNSLGAILAGSAWALIDVQTCGEAEQAVRYGRVPIVLCNLALEDRPWQETLEKLRLTRNGACVILLADESAGDLASEVVQQGGFDLLFRPFERQQIFQSLFFAYSCCKLSWPIGLLGHVARVKRLSRRKRR